MKKKFKFDLGETVVDLVSGFTGVIISRADYLTGCDQYCVRPNGKIDERPKAEWFDEMELKVLLTGKKLVLDDSKEDGGPKDINRQL